METELDIIGVLDVSTSHIRADDLRRLQSIKNSGNVTPTPYGWFVTTKPDNPMFNDMSPEFRMFLTLGLENDCEYVLFDEEGADYEQFPVFDHCTGGA